MVTVNRRLLVLQLAAAGLASSVVRTAATDELERVSEDDPSARSQGFRIDTQRVDEAKYPAHTAAQRCGSCRLFGGNDGAAVAPCSFYGGHLVPSIGWCRNFKIRPDRPAPSLTVQVVDK